MLTFGNPTLSNIPRFPAIQNPSASERRDIAPAAADHARRHRNRTEQAISAGTGPGEARTMPCLT